MDVTELQQVENVKNVENVQLDLIELLEYLLASYEHQSDAATIQSAIQLAICEIANERIIECMNTFCGY